MHSMFIKTDWKEFGYFEPSISEIYYGLFSDSEDLSEVARLHFYELPDLVLAELIPCLTDAIKTKLLPITKQLFIIETLLATAKWIAEAVDKASLTKSQSKIEDFLRSNVSVFFDFLTHESPVIRRVAVELIATVDEASAKNVISRQLIIETDSEVQRKYLELAGRLNCTNLIGVVEEFISSSNRAVRLQAAISYILLCGEQDCSYSVNAVNVLATEILNPEIDSHLFCLARDVLLSVAREGILSATRIGIQRIKNSDNSSVLASVLYTLELLFGSERDSVELVEAQQEFLYALVAIDGLWEIDNLDNSFKSDYGGYLPNIGEILKRFHLPSDRASLLKYVQGQE